MNRLVLFAFLFTLLVLAVVGLEQEEQQSSLDRLPREAERPGKGSAEKKQKLKKKEKRKSKKKEKRLGRKLGDGKGKKGKKGKKGTKNPTKSKSKSKSKKNPKENNRHARMNTWATKASTCAVNATCLVSGVLIIIIYTVCSTGQRYDLPETDEGCCGQLHEAGCKNPES
jgi:hypothetical protein